MTDILASQLTINERLPHRAHQLDGVRALVNRDDPAKGRLIPGRFALFDEVGAGKTKQCVDSAQVLHLAGDLDTVVVITPGFARSTWADQDPQLGEVAKHAWASVPNTIHEFHGKRTTLDLSARGLHWVVSNYEFIRREARRNDLIAQLRGRRTWLILDESWCVANHSDQTRACWMLARKRADRVTILNGTPLNDGKPINLYYQFAILDPEIIGAKNKAHFKAKYCVMGGPMGRTVLEYKDLDDLNKRVAPYILSRRTRDCFDLPPMLPPVTIEAKLSDPTWKIYREMRDDMAAWVGGQASVSRQAIVKLLRLMQITSGYLGGLSSVDPDLEDTAGPQVAPAGTPPWLQRKLGLSDPIATPASALTGPTATITKEIGREKLDAFTDWFSRLARPDNMVMWCRFRPELERATKAMGAFYPEVLNLKGGQTKDERLAAKRLLAPGSKTKGAVVGNQKAGGASLNFSAANLMVFLSNGLGLIERTQAIGRIERPGATQPLLIVDVVATGPKGQRTVDHKILKALRAKDDMARWTMNEWRTLLRDED